MSLLNLANLMTVEEQIERFLDGGPHAVVGASTNREKYGNKVLRVYQQNDRTVIPVNPKADEVEGLHAVADLESIAEPVHGISIITPPAISEQIVQTASELGITNIWMQPGAEFDGWGQMAERLGLNVIAGGPCILVSLNYRESV